MQNISFLDKKKKECPRRMRSYSLLGVLIVDKKGGNRPRIPVVREPTVNVETFAQYIFSHISHSTLGARKFDVSENYNHNRTNIIKWYVH